MKTRLHFCSNAASIRILLLLLLFGLCPTHTDWFIQQMFWHRLFDRSAQLLSTPIWPLMILLTLFIDMQAGEISARTVSCISIRNAITTYHKSDFNTSLAHSNLNISIPSLTIQKLLYIFPRSGEAKPQWKREAREQFPTLENESDEVTETKCR